MAVEAAQNYFGWPRGFSFAVISGSVVVALVIALFVDARAIDRAEAARHESEQRFRLVADTAPVMIWQSGTDTLCHYFNKQWLKFTGRTIDQELGSGWTDGVHPEDLEACTKTYISSFEKRESYRMRYRLQRGDGRYRWVMASGVPRYTETGKFAGYIGTCIDITEQKEAEDALGEFGARLIQAQDDERNWIAREIHDDFQQRLAMFAIRLQEMAQSLDPSHPEIARRLSQLWDGVRQFSEDLNAFAHRLHSATLHFAGLTSGLRTLCAEFSDRFGISVSFEAENVPQSIPDDVALCLFRVTQEALQNIKKHSGATSGEVRLMGHDGQIHLSISDPGKGFSQDAISMQAGLGIQSMKERVRLVRGKLELNVHADAGSRIDVLVPIQTEELTLG
jgi:PAS domain S-box-containing protein